MLFPILLKQQRFLQKIYELDLLCIQKIGITDYAKYLSSLTDDNTVTFKEETTNFSKRIEVSSLKNIYEALPLVTEDFQKIVEKPHDSRDLKNAQKILEELPMLTEKLEKDLNQLLES